MEIRQVIYVGIVVLCIGMMLYQVARRGLEGLAALLFRLSGGTVGILCANAVFRIFQLPGIGINLFSLSVLGGLGTPGAVLLYLLLNVPYK